MTAGALSGDRVALRRILGARRGGRIGTAFLATGLLLGVPVAFLPPGLLLHLFLSWLLRGWLRSASLPLASQLRLGSWTVGPTLLLAATLRPIWPESAVAGFLGIGLGHVLLLRGLRKGLADPGPAAPRVP